MAEPKAYEPVSQRGNRSGLQALLGGRLQLFWAGTWSAQWNLVGSIFRGQRKAFGLHQYRAGRAGCVSCCHRWPQKSASKSGSNNL